MSIILTPCGKKPETYLYHAKIKKQNRSSKINIKSETLSLFLYEHATGGGETLEHKLISVGSSSAEISGDDCPPCSKNAFYHTIDNYLPYTREYIRNGVPLGPVNETLVVETTLFIQPNLLGVYDLYIIDVTCQNLTSDKSKSVEVNGLNSYGKINMNILGEKVKVDLFNTWFPAWSYYPDFTGNWEVNQTIQVS